MGYKVIYGKERDGQTKAIGFRCLVLTIAFFVLFLQTVTHFWPEGEAIMRSLLFSEDSLAAEQAIQTFSQELSSGFSLTDAAKNFWVTVFRDGYPG